MQLHFIDSAATISDAIDRPIVVLIHGLFGSLSNLAVLASALSADYRVIRMDLRNHGRSSHAESMSLPELAKDILDTLDALNIEHVALVGHSLGGKVAMEVALCQPHRIDALLVADMAPVKYPPFHNSILKALDGLDLSICSSRTDVVQALQQSINEKAVCDFLAQNIVSSASGLKWRINVDVLLSEYHKLIEALDSGRQYNGPCLFIGAEHSAYLKPEHASATKALFPNFRYREMMGVGHWLHAEKPEVFNAYVSRFLGSKLLMVDR